MQRWLIPVLAALLLLIVTGDSLRADPGPAETPTEMTAADTRAALNMLGILTAGFLMFFMQVGFALIETGMTRAKNVAHTMSMNLMVYSIGALGFWATGFALMYGSTHGGAGFIPKQFSLHLFGHEFGLFGRTGFFLGGIGHQPMLLALFLFQMMFMDTTATIPTGAMAERWRFSSFLLTGLFIGSFLFPIYGNWVWGNGWLARLGHEFGLGNGHVDFAGSSVVHMTGGLTALVGAYLLGPRIGKYKPDGTPNPVPAHNVPMYMMGTLMLAFGWFGFNTGNSLAVSDLNSARIAVNTVLSSAAGAFTSLSYMWIVYRKPDPSFLCNGLLAGLVAITAGCAFVAPVAAVFIGAVAGVLVVWSCLFVERVLKIDDPVGSISVHGTNGIWGILALGLFADGSFGHGLNGSYWYRFGDGSLHWFADRLTSAQQATYPGPLLEQGVTGLFYGSSSQMMAGIIGIIVNALWVLPVMYAFFSLVGTWIGNRVPAQTEMQGLDVPELGTLGYIQATVGYASQDPRNAEARIVVPRTFEPRPALMPPEGGLRFMIIVDGVDVELLTRTWSALCQVGEQPPSDEFRAVYPYMTTVQGNRFTFRGGDAETIRAMLERLFQNRLVGKPIRARLASSPAT